mmetsp:Transcript_16631/g.24261  ORF Transcript_16631/g.24261 Transcript_16631/m.24261 type:complete len:230 (-) Transcript_16631:1399-2088(-)
MIQNSYKGPTRLGRHNSGNLVGPSWHLNRITPESKVTSNENKWRCNADPEEEGADDGEERYGCGASVESKEHVQGKEHCHYTTREESCGEESVPLPVLTAAELKDTRGNISRCGSAENVEEDNVRQGLSLHDGVDKVCLAHQQASKKAKCNLNSTSYKYRQRHGAEGGRAEHVTMNHFPSPFLEGVFFVVAKINVNCIVRHEVLSECLDENPRGTTHQEQYQHDRVDKT